jgi:hypothetical protein
VPVRVRRRHRCLLRLRRRGSEAVRLIG